MEIIYSIIGVIITIIFSALFSGMEIAFVSSDKLRLKIDDEKGGTFSGIIAKFMKKPGRYLATMLVGNNIALVIYSMLMTILLDPISRKYFHTEYSILIIQTLITTVIILIIAEFMPKAFFSKNANFMLNKLAGFINIFYFLFSPITKFSVWFSNIIMHKILKIENSDENDKLIFGKIDITNFLENYQISSDNETEETNLKIFQNALDFASIKLRECMIPRIEIEAIEINETTEEITKKFIKTGFSKILVYEENIDNIIGYFHSSDILKQPKSIKDKLRKVIIVPETMAANKLLNKFIKLKLSLAVVVDEYGGVSGIITIEDIIEEIFGEIEDEHDKTDLVAVKKSENEYLFSGRVEIDYINQVFDLKLPKTPDYETIGGFIVMNYENFPEENEKIIIDQYTLEILKIEETRIELIKLTIQE